MKKYDEEVIKALEELTEDQRQGLFDALKDAAAEFRKPNENEDLTALKRAFRDRIRISNAKKEFTPYEEVKRYHRGYTDALEDAIKIAEQYFSLQ